MCLEYFLNARTANTQAHPRSWGLLIAMLLMKATVSLLGVIAEPIYYICLKIELVAEKLI